RLGWIAGDLVMRALFDDEAAFCHGFILTTAKTRCSLMGQNYGLTRSNGGRLQSRPQPAKDPVGQAWQDRQAQAEADVPVRQLPDVGLSPRLPEILDGFRWRHQILEAC